MAFQREILLPHQEAQMAAEHQVMEAELCALMAQGEHEVQTTVVRFRHMVSGTLETENGEQRTYEWLRLQHQGGRSNATIDLRPLHARPTSVLSESGRFFVAQRTGMHTESDDMRYVQRDSDGQLVLHTLVAQVVEEQPEAPAEPAGNASFEAWTAYEQNGVGGVAVRALHYAEPMPNAYFEGAPAQDVVLV